MFLKGIKVVIMYTSQGSIREAEPVGEIYYEIYLQGTGLKQCRLLPYSFRGSSVMELKSRCQQGCMCLSWELQGRTAVWPFPTSWLVGPVSSFQSQNGITSPSALVITSPLTLTFLPSFSFVRSLVITLSPSHVLEWAPHLKVNWLATVISPCHVKGNIHRV